MSIDYAKAAKQFPVQKAALTRAIKSKDAEKVIAAARKAVAQWEETGAWPDHWHRWQIALNDAFNWAWAEHYGHTDVPRPDPNRFDIDSIRRDVILGTA